MLHVISQVSKDDLVPGEDWDCLMWHNSKLFSAGYGSGIIKVWSPELKLISDLHAHDYPICHIASGQSSTFFTSSSDCTIKHWDEKQNGDFVLLDTLVGHEEPPRKLRFDTKKNWLYSGDELGKVLIWEDGKLIGNLETFEEIWDLIPHDEILVTSRHLDIIINTLSQKGDKIRHTIKNTVQGKGPFLFTNDKLCFMDRNNFQIHVNEAFKPGNENLAKLEGHNAMVYGMAAHNGILYTGGGDNKLIAWDLTSLSQICELVLEWCVNDIVVSEQGVIYACGQHKSIVALKLTN